MKVSVHTTRLLTNAERDQLADIVDAVLVSRAPAIGPSKVSILYNGLAREEGKP